MGARELFPDVLQNEDGHPDTDSEIQGNLQAALLRFGDVTTAGQVATELNSFSLYPGYFPLEAIRKLRFAGGKTAVGVLVDGLGSANRISQDAQKNFDACVASVTLANQPKQPKEAAQKACTGSFSWAERRTSLMLNALAEMVKDPPLPADAPPTAESSQKWKDWWRKNRDKVRKTQSGLRGPARKSSTPLIEASHAFRVYGPAIRKLVTLWRVVDVKSLIEGPCIMKERPVSRD
jgi:hypothetical protein